MIEWYFKPVYDRHFRLSISGGRNTYIPRLTTKVNRIHCKHSSDCQKCYAYIDGEIRFHFKSHSSMARHCHSTISDWTDSSLESDSEAAPKNAVARKKQNAAVKIESPIPRFSTRQIQPNSGRNSL